jgi:hypothetical protein
MAAVAVSVVPVAGAASVVSADPADAEDVDPELPQPESTASTMQAASSSAIKRFLLNLVHPFLFLSFTGYKYSEISS